MIIMQANTHVTLARDQTLFKQLTHVTYTECSGQDPETYMFLALIIMIIVVTGSKLLVQTFCSQTIYIQQEEVDFLVLPLLPHEKDYRTFENVLAPMLALEIQILSQ